MKSLKESIKSAGSKIDKKALITAIGLMLMSWTALPAIYWLLVKRRKNGKGELIENSVEEEKDG